MSEVVDVESSGCYEASLYRSDYESSSQRIVKRDQNELSDVDFKTFVLATMLLPLFLPFTGLHYFHAGNLYEGIAKFSFELFLQYNPFEMSFFPLGILKIINAFDTFFTLKKNLRLFF